MSTADCRSAAADSRGDRRLSRRSPAHRSAAGVQVAGGGQGGHGRRGPRSGSRCGCSARRGSRAGIVTEPEAGRTIVETYPETGIVTTFIIEPAGAERVGGDDHDRPAAARRAAGQGAGLLHPAGCCGRSMWKNCSGWPTSSKGESSTILCPPIPEPECPPMSSRTSR